MLQILNIPRLFLRTVSGSAVSASVFAYDDTGMLESEAQTLFGGTQRTVSYGYDQVGFRTQTAYPDGSTTITRTNTFDGRINTLSRGQTQLAAFQYLGSRTARRAYNTSPAVNTDYGYDKLGRVTDITAGSLADFHYDYVADQSNIWKIRFDHRSGTPYNEYGYDDIDRVTQVTYLDSDTENFVMDDLGNRFGNQTLRDDGTVNFAVNTETNRYTSVAGHNLAYDDAGNLTQDKDGYKFTYDYENRITEIRNSANTLIAKMDYDTQGRRIRKVDSIANTTTLYYYSDNWQVLAEYNSSGTQQAYYAYGNYIDEVLLMCRNNTDYFYLHDHLYSPVALLDSSGSIVERYEYDVYGTSRILSTNYDPRTTSSFGNFVAFTGRELDTLDNGGLKKMHYRHREYNPYMGRFYQEDLLGIQPSGIMEYNPFSPTAQYSDSLSLYLAFRALPIRNIDPYGLWGTLVHLTKTRVWAERVLYPSTAASAVAAADEAVDSGATSPMPIFGDQSYHFNRNLNGGPDTRIGLFYYHFKRAKIACHPAMDNPETAAKELGTSLHPLQDWVAHADYAMKNTGSIWTIHNSRSPQDEFGNPGGYPDDVTLDVVGSPDGRASRPYIIDVLYTKDREGNGPFRYTDFAYYEKGFKRYNLTRVMTIEELKEYQWYVRANGGCKCKKYFLGEE
jgi:RHS repeat-associated protein